MQLYFIRHGETDLNREGRIQGRTNADMNLIGFKQANLLAKRLSHIEFDYAFTSPLNRALQTAEEIVRNRDVVIHKMENLTNTDLGKWQGHKWRDIVKEYSINAYNVNKFIKIRGGESFEDVAKRLDEFLKEVEVLNAKRILVVTHAALILTFIKKLTGLPLDRNIPLKCSNSGITVFERDMHDKWFLRTFNDISHLEDF